ncbi:MAG: Ig-like domain-containing protein [Candidatus Bathyarchaeia archaeon]
MFLYGCGGGGGGPAQPPTQPSPTLLDASGRTITEVNEETHPTILAKITGLPPGKTFELMLYRDGQPLYRDAQGNIRPIIATSDDKGEIPTVVLFYDLGVEPETGRPTSAAGNYTVRVYGSGVDLLIPLTVKSRLTAKPRGARQEIPGLPPTIWVVRANGAFAGGSVREGDPVYAEGINFPPNRRVRLYIVRDRSGWNSGAFSTDLENIPNDVIEEVATDGQGNLQRTLVWSSAQPINDNRDFDLIANVADANGNFDIRYTPGVDAVCEDLIAGFTVQGAPQHGVRIDLASDQQGNYRSKFDTTETVTIWVNPPWRPLIPFMMVKKYICPHKETWNYGDRLVDVTGRPKWDLVRYACLNQYLYTVWAPPLTPGIYDPVIDVNQNDVYDEGDVLGKPFKVEGQGPRPKRLFVSARFPIIDPNESTPVTAILISENDCPIPGQTMQFSVSDTGASINPTSAQTDGQGIASATLRAGSTGGVTIRVRATATVEGVTITGETEVQVRAYGGLNAIVRSKRTRK